METEESRQLQEGFPFEGLSGDHSRLLVSSLLKVQRLDF